jgi:hypothetical protein
VRERDKSPGEWETKKSPINGNLSKRGGHMSLYEWAMIN